MYPPLVLENVTKRFGRLVAVDNLSLTVPPGSVVGLIGPNGSGKTTLINCCVGILKPERGRILVAGHDLTAGDVEGKRFLAFAPEMPDPMMANTAWDHFVFISRMLEWQDGWQEEATRLLGTFDMLEKKDQATNGFSKGEKQKLMLAMAFLRKPAIAFLDEPLIGLDPRAALSLKREVRALVARGGSAVICSHVLSLVEELADALAVMSRGKLAFLGTPDGLRVAASEEPGSPLEEAFTRLTEPGPGSREDEE